MSRIEKPLLTKSQVAELLAVSNRTIDRLVAAGKLQPIRIGRSCRFSHQQLDSLLNSSIARGFFRVRA